VKRWMKLKWKLKLVYSDDMAIQQKNIQKIKINLPRLSKYKPQDIKTFKYINSSYSSTKIKRL